MADLEHARVAVWGYGREGRAALAALRRRFPHRELTLLCSADEKAQAPDDVRLNVITETIDAQTLKAFDVVVKSPGISPYKAPVPEAQAAGVKFTSGTALWFAENRQARVIGVTGTKGKSTTSAMIAHIARALEIRTALAGNIGLPLLDLDGQQADLWVVELSSFQTGEAGPLEVGVITNLYEEHLDWHDSRERYAADKLKIVDVARALVVNAEQPELLARTATHPQRVLYPNEAGWHLHDGIIYRGETDTAETMFIKSIRGQHNWLNALAALTALDATGLLSDRCTRYGCTYSDASDPLADFQGLPHRLQTLGERNHSTYINDSISTTPYATIEALRSLLFHSNVVAIVGGFDRGVDWSECAAQIAKWPWLRFVAQGANGSRIAKALRDAGVAPGLVHETADLAEAVKLAQKINLGSGGVILLSPGAPSFDQFTDYAERGREFARLAGFDPTAIAQIEGLGIR